VLSPYRLIASRILMLTLISASPFYVIVFLIMRRISLRGLTNVVVI
jgi:hypothetical protein